MPLILLIPLYPRDSLNQPQEHFGPYANYQQSKIRPFKITICSGHYRCTGSLFNPSAAKLPKFFIPAAFIALSSFEKPLK